MKLAILNDTHCGTRNSSDIFLDNAEKFYSDVLFPYLLEHNIKHIVHLGDYYDNRKFINFRALNRNRNHFLKPLREYGITMDIICGNHDVYYKNTSDLNSLKELLGHYMNEVTIIQEPTVMEYGSLKMGLVPWIDSTNEKQSLDFLAKAKCDWIGGHFDIQGYEMMKGIKCEHGLDRAVFSRFEQVLSGHFHTKSQQHNIMYLGSQKEFFGMMHMIRNIFTSSIQKLGKSSRFITLILYFIAFTMTIASGTIFITIWMRLTESL